VFPAKSYTGEGFYAQMDKSGRITIPALTRKILEAGKREEQSLIGLVLEIRLQPA
jgi:DNA-binding transcriptional regulator/RsmH inhibitor MraZ